MAIAEQNSTDEPSTATCPLCDDYEGKPSSVEAHISRSTDPIHKGEVGRAHRDDLERQANSDDADSSEDPGIETSDDRTTPSSEPGTTEGISVESSDDRPVQATDDQEGSDGDFSMPQGDGEAQSPDTDTMDPGSHDGQDADEDDDQHDELRERVDDLAASVEEHADRLSELEGNMPTDEEYEQFRISDDSHHDHAETVEGVATETDTDASAGGGSGFGIPITGLAVALVAGIAVYWFVFRDSSSPSSSTGGQDSNTDDTTLVEGGDI